MLILDLPDSRSRERPKIRYLFVVRKGIKVVGVKEEEAMNRFRWRQLICYRLQDLLEVSH